MKKRILSLFLLLSVLCLAACQGADTSATTKKPTETTTPPPDKPEPFIAQLYTPYAYLETFTLVPNAFNPLSVPGLNIRPSTDNLYFSNITYEQNVEDISWEWAGMTLTAKYQYTDQRSFGISRMDPTRYYKADGYGTICYDVASGKWVVADFCTSNLIDQNATGEKLSQEECRVIAHKYIEDYILNIEPSLDLSEYTYREMDLQGQKHPFYNFVYEKYVNGYLTRDNICCGVTEYGSMVYFGRGDDYSSFEDQMDEIDFDQVFANLSDAAQLICDYQPALEMTYTLGLPAVYKEADGTYHFEMFVWFHYLQSGEKVTAAVAFMIPLT